MIPKTANNLQDIEVTDYGTKTYKINKESGRVEGFIDGKESVKQAIMKILNTERFAYEIYNDQYGNELESLIGKDYLFVKNDIKRLIEEALFTDDRISSVEEFTITEPNSHKDYITVSFMVVTNQNEIIIVEGQEVLII